MYLNLIQLAESFGVEESEVEKWVRNDHLPCIHDRERLWFDRAQVVEWAASRGLAAKAGFLAPGKTSTDPAGQCEKFLRIGGIWRDVTPESVLDVLEKILGALPGTSPAARQLLIQRLRGEDGITWTPVGHGFALPHLRTRVALGRDSGTLALVMLSGPLTLAAPPDQIPITRLFFFVAPSPRAHLDLLGKLSKALVREDVRQCVMAGASDDKIVSAFAAIDQNGLTKEKEAGL